MVYYNLEDLRKVHKCGSNIDYFFFYGRRDPAEALVSTACFSQWYLASFIVDSGEYSSEEQFMVAKKAELFADHEIHKAIMKSSDPGTTKKLGRKVRYFDENIWIQHAIDIVIAGNIANFSQNERLSI